MMAAATEVALASATIRVTNSGETGLRPWRRPEIRAFRSRPVHASATAAISNAGTPVQGSGGSFAYTARSSSQPAAAQTTAMMTSVEIRVGFTARPGSYRAGGGLRPGRDRPAGPRSPRDRAGGPPDRGRARARGRRFARARGGG